MLWFDFTPSHCQKIIQAGIRKVVYHMSYATDETSSKLLSAGGVVVEAHASLGRAEQLRLCTQQVFVNHSSPQR
jgi:deoxycytidylate deaminase